MFHLGQGCDRHDPCNDPPALKGASNKGTMRKSGGRSMRSKSRTCLIPHVFFGLDSVVQ